LRLWIRNICGSERSYFEAREEYEAEAYSEEKYEVLSILKIS
jgi:hypothetical protein